MIYWILVGFSIIVVGGNYLGSVPDEIDWQSTWTYVFFVLGALYFIFMAIITFYKFEDNKVNYYTILF